MFKHAAMNKWSIVRVQKSLLHLSQFYILCYHPPLLSLSYSSFLIYNAECTLHLHHHIIDIAFDLFTCASKEIMTLRLLVPLSPRELFAFVLIAFRWPVVLLLPTLCVQASVNLITQPPHRATRKSAVCMACTRPTC